MMKKTALSLSMLVLGAVSLLSVNGRADTIDLSLTTPAITTAAGSTASFEATVTNPSGKGSTIYLNGIDFSTAAPFFPNGDPFFLNFPFFLDPGATFTDLLFTVDVPVGTAAGQYFGTVILLGGSDGAASDTIASTAFEVDVPSAVPEPGSVLLLMTGLPGVGMLVRARLAKRKI